jgi:hypothetical protein
MGSVVDAIFPRGPNILEGATNVELPGYDLWLTFVGPFILSRKR